jgi:hypothetical protein
MPEVLVMIWLRPSEKQLSRRGERERESDECKSFMLFLN